MSKVSYNLGNFNRNMSQASVRSRDSDTKSLTKTTSAQGGLHQKRNSNQKLEPISQPAVTKDKTENKQQNLAQTTSTNQLAQTKTQYTAGLKDSDYLAGSVNKIRTVSEDIKKAYLTNPSVAIDNEAEYYEIVRSMNIEKK